MRPSFARWARWGWLVTTILMGAAMLATAWVGRRQVDAAGSLLTRGQGELLLQSVREPLRDPFPPPAARLDSVLRARSAEGLRYVAIFDSSRVLLAQAGTPTELPLDVPERLAPRPMILEEVSGRYRMIAFLPPGRPRDAARTASAPAAGRPHPPAILLEFEPLAARHLVTEATARLALSAVVAAALAVAAVVFWRLSLQQEATQRRFEQERRLAVLGEMSAVLAHEIRNPLASLKGHAQLLAERLEAGGPEHGKAVLVVREAQRLQTLTDDLLDFARSGPIERAPADPAALLRSVADEVAPGGFRVDAAQAPRTWALDARRLRQALANVLRNARQATPEGRQPEAAVAREDGALVFTVRDFGPGLPPGDERRIFAPFYTTRASGTGLGLAVAQRVVEMHGGTITAANHPQGGAVFRIAVPA